jgi:hypothetical protein
MKDAGGTQVERLVRYLRANPGATGLEIVTTLAMPKYTSRISDAREQGFVIVCEKDRNGRNGYWLIEAPTQMALAGFR